MDGAVEQAGRFARRVSRSCGAVVAAGGLLVLAGWLFDIGWLKTVRPGLAAMRPNAALGLALSGVALSWRSAWTRPLAALVLVIGGITLVEHIGGIELGVDRWLSPHASRMAPATAVDLTLIGGALLLLDAPLPLRRSAEWLARLAGLIALLALLGHLYGARSLQTQGLFDSVAEHSALLCFIVSLGTMAARPENALARLWTAPGAAGVLTRRMLPAALLVPTIAGWVLLQGQLAGYYGTEVGSTLFATSNILCFGALVWWTASSLVRADRARHAAEQATRESEERLARTLDSIGDAVIATDSRGAVVRLNAVAEKLTGWSSAEASGRPLADVFRIVDEPTGDPLDDVLEPALRDGVAVSHGQPILLLGRDGTATPGAHTTAPIRGPDGAVRGVVLVFHDQSTARQLEQARITSLHLQGENRQMATTSRLKSDFVANMSHELRTPLNSILGFTCLILDGRAGAVTPEQREYLGDVLASGQHLLHVINEILDLSKVEAGKLELYPEPTQLRLVVGEVLATLREQATRKTLTLESRIADDLPEVVIDPLRFKQVLYNYLSNAIKFTPERGRVQVTVALVGGDPSSFRVDVQDSGHGVAEADLAKLFVEFSQLDAGMAKRYQGTGLGLALVKRLVEAQGGRVEVRSRVGEGSTFSAILPCRADAAAPHHAASVSAGDQSERR